MKFKKFDDFTYVFLVSASQMAYIEDAHKTHALLQRFNELYRYMIREDKSSLLSGELKALQNYIDIYVTRYEGRFGITIENLLDDSDIYIDHLCLLDFVDDVLSNALTLYEEYFNIHLTIQIDKYVCATISLKVNNNMEIFEKILTREVK